MFAFTNGIFPFISFAFFFFFFHLEVPYDFLEGKFSGAEVFSPLAYL